MKTYEEVIATNPDAAFWLENDSVSFELEEELNYCDDKPTIFIAIPKLLSLNAESVMDSIQEHLSNYAYEDWELTYDSEDMVALQKYIDNIILKHKEYNTIYMPGKEINIDNLWNRLQNAN